jgi:hypothetical protein
MSHWWKRGTLNLIKGSMGQVVKLAQAAWSVVSLVWQFMFVTVGICLTLTRHLAGMDQSGKGDVAALAAREQADVQTIDRYIEALLAKEEADVAAILGTMSAGLSALSAGEQSDVAALNATIGNDVRSLNATINSDVAALNSTIRSDVLNLNNRITSVQTVLAGREATDVNSLKATDAANLGTAERFATSAIAAATPGIIARAVAQISPELSAVKTEINDCLDPLCNTVTPQAPRAGRNLNWLKNLELLGVEALLVALAAECLTHPAAVADEVGSVMHAVGDGPLAAFRHLVGD